MNSYMSDRPKESGSRYLALSSGRSRDISGGVAFTRYGIDNAKYRADVVNRLSKLHAEAEVGASLLPLITLFLRDAYRREMTEVWREMGAAFDRERERQIKGMVAAMQRFLSAAKLPSDLQ